VSRLRVGVLVSGRGSNLQALIEAAKDPFYPARVVMVCANRECAALEGAKKAGVSHQLFRLADFPDRRARDQAMVQTLRLHGVELVVCAGYDAILERTFTGPFAGRIINVHPSLLPEFAGTMDAVTMALQAGVAETGCTVHVVTKDVDQGPILGQRRVEVRPDDTVESLRERIQAEEHRLLPVIVKRLAGQPLPLSV
jgi:phosphoribosylglycinamide formyltransferase-1